MGNKNWIHLLLLATSASSMDFRLSLLALLLYQSNLSVERVQGGMNNVYPHSLSFLPNTLCSADISHPQAMLSNSGIHLCPSSTFIISRVSFNWLVVHTHTHICVHMCKVRGRWWVSCTITLCLTFYRQGLLVNLTTSKSPVVILSPLQVWGFSCTYPHPDFYVGIRIWLIL